MVTVAPPQPGQRAFTLRKDLTVTTPGASSKGYPAGTIFVRYPGRTEIAEPGDIRALEDRYAAEALESARTAQVNRDEMVRKRQAPPRSDTLPGPHAPCGDGGGDSQEGSVMSSAQLYDTIGATYTVTRRTEPRIAARVWAALGDARTVLNVGAGTGSYEPSDRDVLAVEPSALMRAQRPADAAPCVAATAESLPFEDESFDAAMAFSTIDHWQDPIAGLREMRRVARRVVVFTFDTSDPDRFWLTRDYLPEATALRACRVLASLTELARAIGARMEPVPIPWDCADGFYEAYWRRPEAYLDDHVRRGISVWARVGPDAEQRAVRSLRDDLASGRWAQRNRDLVALEAAELGARLLIA